MAFKNIKDFSEDISKRIKDYLPSYYAGAEIRCDEISKNNIGTLTGLSIVLEGDNFAPIIYLNSYYDDYVQGKEPDEILSSIAKERVEFEKLKPPMSIELTDWQNAKEYLFPKLINAERNAENLKQMPHRIIADLAVVYAVMVDRGDFDSYGYKVTYDVLKNFGISEEMLHETAVNNLAQKHPIKIESLAQSISRLTDTPLPGDCEGNDSLNIFIVTTERHSFGAAAILCSFVQKAIGETVGEKCYVIPSSVHELLLIPMNAYINPADVRSMIKEINNTVVAPSEVLSDNLYIYDADSNHLEIA